MGWVHITKGVLVVGGAVAAVGVGALALMPSLPPEPVEAIVTGIYPEPHLEGFPPTVRVVGRTADGRVGAVSVRADQVRCRRGEKMRAIKQGVSLYLDRTSCIRLKHYN